MTNKLSCYRPLNRDSREIRILELLPALHPLDNRILCLLTTQSLDHRPFYEALSYTWGEADSYGFENWLDETLVPVRRNLLCALRVLRAERCRYLWIDALCINQHDDRERGHQVEMMGSVYRQAAQVLSWLGTPDEKERGNEELDVATAEPEGIPVPAFRFLEDVAEIETCISLRPSSHRCVPRWDPVKTRCWELYELHKDSWAQLESLCTSSYWTRMWITQEVCLARRLKVLYGRDMVDWDAFAAFSKHFFAPDFGDVELAHALRRLRATQPFKLEATMRKICHGGLELRYALDITKGCVCRDRRDKVYGVLGLLRSFREGTIEVNYNVSLFKLYETLLLFQMTTLAFDPSEMVNFTYVVQRTLLGSEYDEAVMSSRGTLQTIMQWEELTANREENKTLIYQARWGRKS